MVEISKKSSFLYFLIILMSLTIFTLGFWWLFLLHNLSLRLSVFESQFMEINWVRMILWEGALFFLILLIATISFLWVFFQNMRRSNNFQILLSAIGHDLKTPLSLIRLTSEMLQEKVNELEMISNHDKAIIDQLGNQLLEDAKKFEFELEKLLYFSKIHFSKKIPLEMVDLNLLVDSIILAYPQLKFQKISDCQSQKILAQTYCLELIIKNLISNTLKHSSSKEILIKIECEETFLKLIFEELNAPFSGDLKKLGLLTYNNSKNSLPTYASIGLYLTKQLILQMKGKITFKKNPNLRIELYFILPRKLA